MSLGLRGLGGWGFGAPEATAVAASATASAFLSSSAARASASAAACAAGEVGELGSDTLPAARLASAISSGVARGRLRIRRWLPACSAAWEGQGRRFTLLDQAGEGVH
jgi:hypothetical protein